MNAEQPGSQHEALKRFSIGVIIFAAAVLLFVYGPLAVQTEAAVVPEEWTAYQMQPSASALKTSKGTWILKKGKLRFKANNGKYVTDTIKKIGKQYYHFDKKGYVSTGWIKYNGSTYYACKTAGKNGVFGNLAVGWKTMGGRYYYFKSKGAMAKGWQKIDGQYYYFTKKGALTTGWAAIKNKRFYFEPTGGPGVLGRMYRGWHTIDETKYFFAKTGETGTIGSLYADTWKSIGKSVYYFDEDGAVITTGTSQNAFIEIVGEMARKDMKKTGILASVTTAQAIIESNYGQSVLSLKAHNLFGMKASLSGNNWGSVWTGSTYTKSTREETSSGRSYYIKAAFRSYSSYALSVADHSAYLAGARKADGSLRYKGIVGCKNYTKAAKIIKNGGYATAGNYVSALVAVIKKYNLTRFDK